MRRTSLMLLGFGVLLCGAFEIGARPGGKKVGGDGGLPGSGGAFPGDVGGGPGQDPNAMFDYLAKGRQFFLISETRTLSAPLTEFAQAKGITNGQITRQQYVEFQELRAKQQLGEGGKGFPGGFGKKKDFNPGIPVADGLLPKAMRWEYHIATTRMLSESPSIFDLETALNKLGAEGWELIAIEPGSDKGRLARYVFRRPAGAKLPGDIKPKADPAPKEKTEVRLELRMYQLKNANAQDLAALISEVMRTSTKDPLRVTADPRTNHVIVNGTAKVQEEIEALLSRLDVPAAEREGDARFKKKAPGFSK